MSNHKRARENRFASKGAARGGKSSLGQNKFTVKRPASGPVSSNRKRGFAGGERPYDYSAYEAEPATPEYLARLFKRHGTTATKEQLGRFWTLYDLLRTHNARLDLTRIMGIEATVLKHFVDSAIILEHVDLAGPVLDIGTGPGFPGLPLAIMRPDLRFVLAESRGKRVTFLEEAVKKMRLDNVDIFPRSVREDSQLGDDYDRPVTDIVTRALEAIPPTLERILPFVKESARVVFMKGPNCDDEIAAANQAYAGIYTLAKDVQYTLPASKEPRRLVVYAKTGAGR